MRIKGFGRTPKAPQSNPPQPRPGVSGSGQGTNPTAARPQRPSSISQQYFGSPGTGSPGSRPGGPGTGQNGQFDFGNLRPIPTAPQPGAGAGGGAGRPNRLPTIPENPPPNFSRPLTGANRPPQMGPPNGQGGVGGGQYQNLPPTNNPSIASGPSFAHDGMGGPPRPMSPLLPEAPAGVGGRYGSAASSNSPPGSPASATSSNGNPFHLDPSYNPRPSTPPGGGGYSPPGSPASATSSNGNPFHLDPSYNPRPGTPSGSGGYSPPASPASSTSSNGNPFHLDPSYTPRPASATSSNGNPFHLDPTYNPRPASATGGGAPPMPTQLGPDGRTYQYDPPQPGAGGPGRGTYTPAGVQGMTPHQFSGGMLDGSLNPPPYQGG